MEIQQLRYFVAAAESQSISRAARRCGVSQPTLSQQVRRLEDGLGTRLFDRIGRGVVITEAGRALLPRARLILGEVEEATRDVSGQHAPEYVRLSIGAIPTMAPFVLPDLVAPLKHEYPQGEFIIREDLTENLLEALVDSEIDVAILSTPLEHELVDVEVISREPMLVVIPADHPFSDLDIVRAADLRNEPAVTLHEMHCLGKQIGEFCTAKRIHQPIACRTTQLATVLELVRRRMGVSIVPEMAARTDSGDGVVFRPIQGRDAYREIAVARRRGRTRPHIDGRMIEVLRECLSPLSV